MEVRDPVESFDSASDPPASSASSSGLSPAASGSSPEGAAVPAPTVASGASSDAPMPQAALSPDGGLDDSQHRPVVLDFPSAALQYGCSRCGRRAASKQALMASQCAGVLRALQVAHRSHKLAIAGDMVFCLSCGCHGTVVVGGLRQNCLHKRASKSAEDRYKRLLRGKHPRENRDIGPFVVLTR